MNTNSTDFACLVTGFLTDYLPHHRCYSRNTILSYRDTLKLFLRFLKEEKENISVSDLIDMVKKVDLNSVQKNITNISKALGLVQSLITKDEINTETYTPRPLYKKFED